MKDRLKKALSFVLTLALLLAACPLNALAAELVPEEEAQPAVLSGETEPVEVEFVAEPEDGPAPAKGQSETAEPETAGTGKAVLMKETYVSGDYAYTLSDGKAIITGYSGAGGNLTIPERLDGYVVDGIWESAFSEDTSLTAVILPSTLTSLGMRAFENCSSLESVTIPAGLEEASWDAFAGCSRMSEVNFEQGITKIPGCLFSGCEWLTHIEIPDTVTEIDARAFQGCENLKTLSIPSPDCTVGESAFQDDHSLTLFCP